MAVDFSLLPAEDEQHVEPPSWRVWSIAFLLMALAGVLAVLYLWPNDPPAHNWRFWTALVLFPVGIPAFVVLRRYSVYESRKLDLELHNEVVKDYRERVFQEASIPLACMGAAYRFSAMPKENTVDGIHKDTVTLRTQDPIAKLGEPVRARWLVVPGMPTLPGTREGDRTRQHHVTRWMFGELLDDLSKPLRALPQRAPLTVQLTISNALTDDENKNLWEECWHARSLRQADVLTSTASPLDLMWLDTWMDEALRSTSLHARLVVAMQLHTLLSTEPPAGTAEAGAALLLMPRDLALRHRAPVTAFLHRPERRAMDLSGDALSHAMKWADTSGPQIPSGWSSGLGGTMADHWKKAAQEHGIAAVLADIDQTVGDAGVAAPWLAIACAASSLTSKKPAQMVLVGRDAHIDCAVLKYAGMQAKRPDGDAELSNVAVPAHLPGSRNIPTS